MQPKAPIPRHGYGAGAALCVPGHFGELMQGRLGPDGPVALITLPCPALTVRGTVQPSRGFHLHMAGASPPPAATMRAFLARLGLQAQGRFALRAGMEPGGGAGFSTATLVALARLAGYAGPALPLAHACLASEGATDPLMLPAPERLLWASRQGRVLGRTAPLPAFDVLGGFFGPPRRTDPRDARFPDIADLWPRWQAAASAGDLPALAALAATSARRTLALRGGPDPDPTEALARDLGALGCVIAHTGAARGLIFAPGAIPDTAPDALRRAGFRAILSFRAGGLSPRPLRPPGRGGF